MKLSEYKELCVIGDQEKIDKQIEIQLEKNSIKCANEGHKTVLSMRLRLDNGMISYDEYNLICKKCHMNLASWTSAGQKIQSIKLFDENDSFNIWDEE